MTKLFFILLYILPSLILMKQISMKPKHFIETKNCGCEDFACQTLKCIDAATEQRLTCVCRQWNNFKKRICESNYLECRNDAYKLLAYLLGFILILLIN